MPSSAPVISSIGHSFATAIPLTVSPSGSAAQNASIDSAGVGDYYRYVAPISTRLVVRDASPRSSNLDTLLTIYDASGKPVPGGSSDDARWVDSQGNPQVGSQVRISVVAGQSYFIEAGGFGASTGGYELSVIPDEVRDSFATARPLVLSAEGSESVGGSISFPGDVSFYQFVAPVSGKMMIEQDAIGFGLDSLLTIFDSTEHLITFDDDSDRSVTGFAENSLVQFSVVAGQTYFVEAAAYPNITGSGATGGFTLQFSTDPNSPIDEEPDTFAKALPVDISSGFAGLSRTIDSDALVNVFQIKATVSESIRVVLTPAANNDFQGYLFAFDDSGYELANDYNLSLLHNETTSTVQFNVVAGRSYFVQVAAYRGRTGAFDLRFDAGPQVRPASAGLGDTFATATELDLDASGSQVVAGTIDEPGGANFFRFLADKTELLTIRLFAAPGSRLDTFLIMFTDSQSSIALNDDSDVALTTTGELDHVIDRNSRIEREVIAGKTYYFEAASAGSSTGSYSLALSTTTDDYGDKIGDSFSMADPTDPVSPFPVQEIAFSSSHSATQLGNIDMPGDLDAFQFTSPTAGLLTVSQQATPGGSLDSQLFAFDSSRQPLASNNDFYGTYNSLVQFNVAAGQTYFLKAGAYGASTGAYILTLSSAPQSSAPGHSFATAIMLAVSSSGPTRQADQIVATGDALVYQFIAPTSGLLTVRQQAASGSPLDSFLYAFDGSQPVNNFDGLQALLASNDDSGGSLDSLVQFNVTAGQTYYLRAAGFGTSIGDYILTLSFGAAIATEGVGRTFADAGVIQLDGLGYGSQTGVITSAGDVHMYRFVAPYTGALTIRQNAPSAGSIADKFAPSKSILDSLLSVFDDSHAQIARNDDHVVDNSLNSYVQISVVAGRTYFVQAAGFGATTGHYDLLFNDDVPNDFADTSLITVDSKLLSATEFGVIEVPDDVDVYRFVAPVSGPIDVTQQATGGSRLDSYLFLFDQSQTLIASNDDETINPAGEGGGLNIPDSLAQANVVAGQTYYIRAASSQARATDPGRSPTGAYRLELTFPAYDFGATFAEARTIPPPAPNLGSQQGNILQIGEVDDFQFAADISGRVTIDFVAPPGIGPVLNPVLVAFDASGDEIARDPKKLTLGVQAHSLYFVQAGGYGTSTGRFELDYRETPGSGLGLDFGSAIPVGLSGSGSATVRGALGAVGTVNVFQFQAIVSGQMKAALESPSPGGLAAFTVSDGTPTQVGHETTQPGVMTFDVIEGQTYFVRVTSNGFGGSFLLDLQTIAATSAPADLQLPGKLTLSQLGAVFVASVPATGPTASEQRLTADQITHLLVTTFVAGQQGHLSGPYLLVWTDPVDFVLTDAKARESGYTAGRGPISEVGGSYNSGAGVLKLVIIPLLSSSYELDLIGVGEGSVLFGAAEITTMGLEVASQGSPGPGFHALLQSMTDLVVVLGFNVHDNPGPPPPPPNPPPPPLPGRSSPSDPVVASASASSSFFGSALFSQATAFFGEFGGGGAIGGANSAALVQASSGVTTLVAPMNPNATPVSAHATEEPEPPTPVDQAVPAALAALAAGLANGDFQSLSPGIRTFVQPIVRGLDSLGGRVWNLLKSIIINLSQPRIATKKAGVRGAVSDPPKTDPAGPTAVVSPVHDDRLDAGDSQLESENEDRLAIPLPASAGDELNRYATGQQQFFVLVLMVTTLGDLRTSRPFPSRFLFRGRTSGRERRDRFVPRIERICPAQAHDSFADRAFPITSQTCCWPSSSRPLGTNARGHPSR
jgi:hypothetical protein